MVCPPVREIIHSLKLVDYLACGLSPCTGGQTMVCPSVWEIIHSLKLVDYLACGLLPCTGGQTMVYYWHLLALHLQILLFFYILFFLFVTDIFYFICNLVLTVTRTGN